MKFTFVLPAFMIAAATAFADSAPDCSALSANELITLAEKSVSSSDPAIKSIAKTNLSMECSRQAEVLDKLALETKNSKKSLEFTMQAVKAHENAAVLLSGESFSPFALPRR